MLKVCTFRQGAPKRFMTPAVADELDLDILVDDKRGQAVFRWEPALSDCPPEFRLFDDSWWMLPYLEDVFAFMAQEKHRGVKPEQLILALKTMGYTVDTA